MSDMRLSCRDATNHTRKIQTLLQTEGVVGCHDKLKDIGHCQIIA
jgi:hypothetical protein